MAPSPPAHFARRGSLTCPASCSCPCLACLPRIQIHARKHKMAPDVDLYQLAKDLPGLSGG